jgi:hypothetical protein
MKKDNQKPDMQAGTFAVIFGSLCLGLAIWVLAFKNPKDGKAYSCAGFGLLLLSWGSRQIAAAKKKKKQELEDAKKDKQHDA